MKPTPDWDMLIQKHLDGLTTEEEAKALSARIVEDAEVRLRYLKAAQIHGALADETLVLDVESEPEMKAAAPELQKVIGRFDWPRQVAAGLVAGMFVGLLGVGMIWAIGSPKVEARVFDIAHGDFETMGEGLTPTQFPVRFGEWAGNPAEVVKEASGNKILRFVRTANVKSDPDGRSICHSPTVGVGANAGPLFSQALGEFPACPGCFRCRTAQIQGQSPHLSVSGRAKIDW